MTRQAQWNGGQDWAAELKERRDWRDNGVSSAQHGRRKMERAGMSEQEVSQLWDHSSPSGEVSDILEVVTSGDE